MEILNERPIDMSFVDYKNQLKIQKDWIKNKKQGGLYYISAEIFYQFYNEIFF